MKHKRNLLVLGILISTLAHANEDEFFQESSEGVLLNETVVSTTGFETSIRNTPNNVTVITKKDIQEEQYSSVAEALKDIPSINITTSGSGSYVDLRGQGALTKQNMNTQIFVNGISISPIDSKQTVALNTIDIESVEAIEIIPGGGSILYGGGTTGGVINIITNSIGNMNPNNYVGYEIGTYNSHNAIVGFGHNVTDDLLIQATYSGDTSEGYRDGLENRSNYGDITAKYRISDKQMLSLKYGRYEGTVEGLTDYLSEAELEEDRTQSGIEEGEYYTSDRTRDDILLNYNYNIKDNLLFTMDSGYIRSKSDTDSMNSAMMGAIVQVGGETESTSIAVRPKLKYLYGNGSSIVFGYDYTKGEFKSEGENNSYAAFGITGDTKTNVEKETHSGFILNTYKFNKFEFTQGYRYEHAKYTMNNSDTTEGKIFGGMVNLAPYSYSETREMDNQAFELALNYLYSDTGNTYVRWEKGYTAPGTNDVIDKVEAGKYEANDLDSEEFTTFEIGVRDYLFGSYVSLTAFHTVKDGEIITKSVVPGDSFYNNGYTKENLDETTRKGIELTLQQTFGKLTLTESYSYIDAKNTAGELDGYHLENVSQNAFTIKGKYDFTDKFNGILTLTHKGDYYINDENLGGKVGEYTNLDVVFNYNPNDGLNLYAGVNNLLNDEYETGVTYSSMSDTYEYSPAEKINFFAGFKYNF